MVSEQGSFIFVHGETELVTVFCLSAQHLAHTAECSFPAAPQFVRRDKVPQKRISKYVVSNNKKKKTLYSLLLQY